MHHDLHYTFFLKRCSIVFNGFNLSRLFKRKNVFTVGHKKLKMLPAEESETFQCEDLFYHVKAAAAGEVCLLISVM